MVWQVIETAPKDGTLILAIEKSGPVLIEWESDGISGGSWRDQDHYGHPDVTHWMPLPTPPKDAE